MGPEINMKTSINDIVNLGRISTPMTTSIQLMTNDELDGGYNMIQYGIMNSITQ